MSLSYFLVGVYHTHKRTRTHTHTHIQWVLSTRTRHATGLPHTFNKKEKQTHTHTHTHIQTQTNSVCWQHPPVTPQVPRHTHKHKNTDTLCMLTRQTRHATGLPNLSLTLSHTHTGLPHHPQYLLKTPPKAPCRHLSQKGGGGVTWTGSHQLCHKQNEDLLWWVGGGYIYTYIAVAMYSCSYVHLNMLKIKKADQKQCENWRRESGSEFHKTSPTCVRGEWRKQLQDFLTRSVNKLTVYAFGAYRCGRGRGVDFCACLRLRLRLRVVSVLMMCISELDEQCIVIFFVTYVNMFMYIYINMYIYIYIYIHIYVFTFPHTFNIYTRHLCIFPHIHRLCREVGGWGRDPFQEISWNLRPVVNGT